MITHVLTFILGFITNTVTDWVFAGANKYQEKRSFGKLIKGFRKYTDHSKLFSIGPLITDCIVWKGIDEKNQRSYSRGDIELEFHQEATNNMTQDMQLFIDENWKTMKEQNPNLTSEPRCGVHSIALDQPKITFYRTNYKNFIGTNKSLANQLITPFITESERKLLSTDDGYKFLSESNFSNDLATATTVITKDNYVLLAKRSKEVFVLQDLIHTSIAEGMHLDKDWNDKAQAPDPFLTIARGAKEELDLNVDPDQVEITSFGLYRPFMQPFVTGKIVVDQTHEEIIENLKKHDNTFEGKVFAVKNNLTNLSPFLFDRRFLGQTLEMAELGKVSIIQCLLQQYGPKKLSKGLIDTYKVVEKYF